MLRCALLVGAISLASPAAAFPRTYFFCMDADPSAPTIRVGPMAPNQTEARFLYPPDHDGPQRGPDMLWIGMSDEGDLRYLADGLSLILAAEETALEVGDQLLPCTLLDLPQDHPRGAYPALARSVGGQMRAGPGADHPVLDQIAEGRTLYLASRTDDLTDGFPWFELYDPDGPAGYIWGAQICPGFEPLEGALPACER